MGDKIPNWQIAVYGVHLLGGLSKRVPTEDVAAKCYELAPDYFSWVKYPQYPDKDIVRSALMDARKQSHGALLQGRAGRGRGQFQRTKADPALDGWMLTEAGVRWISENEERMSGFPGHHEPSGHRQEQLQKMARIREDILFQRYTDSPTSFEPSIGEMAELFRCRVDADRLTWQKRFSIALNVAQAAEDTEILEFLRRCERALESQLAE